MPNRFIAPHHRHRIPGIVAPGRWNVAIALRLSAIIVAKITMLAVHYQHCGVWLNQTADGATPWLEEQTPARLLVQRRGHSGDPREDRGVGAPGRCDQKPLTSLEGCESPYRSAVRLGPQGRRR